MINNNLVSLNKQRSSSSSRSEDQREGQFNDRLIEIGEAFNAEKLITYGVIEAINNDFMSRLVNRQEEIVKERDVPNIIVLYRATHQEAIESYTSGFCQGFSNLCTGRPIAVGFIDLLTKSIKGFYQESYSRLLKIGLILTGDQIGYPKDRIILPFIEEGAFDIADIFKWFNYNVCIKEIFNQILKVFNYMSSLLEIYYKKIELHNYAPVTNVANGGNVVNQLGGKKKNKQGRLFVVSSDRNLQQTERMRLKLNTQNVMIKKVTDDKKNILFVLERYKLLFSIFNYHPSVLNAYLLFEFIVDCMMFTEIAKNVISENKNTYKNFVNKYFTSSFRSYVECLEMLLPYAREVTQAFNINLDEDKRTFVFIDTIKKTWADSIIEEFEEYERIEKELEVRENSKKKTNTVSLSKEIKQVSQPVKKKALNERKVQETKASQLTLDERKAIEETKALNASLRADAKVKAQQEKSRAETARAGKEKIKEVRTNERKVTRAQDIVEAHKEQKAQEDEVKIAERYKQKGKIHHMPSQEFVRDNIIAELRGNNAKHFKMLFGKIEYNNKMNDDHVINLIRQIRDILDQHRIGCAQDFFNHVKLHLHYRHDSDTGSLLPRHYIDILRSFFIIFGIFPESKDWEPKVLEDFKAMERYLQRLEDFAYWESKL